MHAGETVDGRSSKSGVVPGGEVPTSFICGGQSGGSRVEIAVIMKPFRKLSRESEDLAIRKTPNGMSSGKESLCFY